MGEAKAVLTDIEGTTSSLSFVKDVLFPYARAQMGDFLRARSTEAEVQEQLVAVSREVGQTLDLEEAISRLVSWIDEDKKITPLKALQGLIWEAGYKNGDFTGHIYKDALEHLRAWHEKGVPLYVYSSGSVYAQKLLFGFTEFGDLNPIFRGYFDTKIGQKKEAESYAKIAREIGESPGDILFLSDIVEELDAAAASGMKTCLLAREGENEPPAECSHPVARDFSGISLAN